MSAQHRSQEAQTFLNASKKIKEELHKMPIPQILIKLDSYINISPPKSVISLMQMLFMMLLWIKLPPPRLTLILVIKFRLSAYK